ncbi:MAG: 4Fe-4S dicluster domain-containing protein [Bacteroidetes bacterium]|nr:MAG: 4Fe-4S dicluster domain-containing protein [Bacteroidota bacterium]
MIGIVVFALLWLVGIGFFGWNVMKVRNNILLGREIDRSDRKSDRWKTMILVAFGQKKMFTRPIPALLHLCIYAAFVITQIELIEILADGLSGGHRLFHESLGGFYTFMISFIEILSVLAFIATVIFLSRRNLLKVPRLVKSEMNGWPKLDANLILFAEITLICFIFMMNGADEVLYNAGQSHAEGQGSFGFAISSWLGPVLFGDMGIESLHVIERIGWWGHLAIVLGFLNYLPYSKHFHIVLAFPNTFYSNLEKKGRFTNMESVTKEVKLMMDPNADPYAAPAEGEDAEPQRFGAKDVTDLTWKNLLDAYTCTECGRCTSSCPANQTGKLLSPRKIMMDTRDRLVEVGENKRKHGKEHEDGKSLFDYISEEEIWACTSCNACVQECPVNIDPLSIIVDLRRYLVMEESKVPAELAGMLTNIENNGAPWQFAAADRLNWKDEN